MANIKYHMLDPKGSGLRSYDSGFIWDDVLFYLFWDISGFFYTLISYTIK